MTEGAKLLKETHLPADGVDPLEAHFYLLRSQLVRALERLEEKIREKQEELKTLTEQVDARRLEHHQVEMSLRTLRAHKEEIRKTVDEILEKAGGGGGS